MPPSPTFTLNGWIGFLAICLTELSGACWLAMLASDMYEEHLIEKSFTVEDAALEVKNQISQIEAQIRNFLSMWKNPS